MQFLVTLTAPITKDAVAALTDVLDEFSGHVGSYIPDHTVIVIASRAAVASIKALPGVVWVGDYQPSYKAVQERCDDECNVSGGGRKLSIVAPIDRLQGLVHWLAEQPTVHWIAPRPKGRAANFFASAIGQCARAAPVTNGNGQYAGDNGTHPIWDAGLQGQGQIVGMGDTGLDMTQCMFIDANVPFTTTSKDAGGSLIFDSTSHRKLRFYREFVDGADGNGHGTHCGGSAAGSLQIGFSPWQGMAPQAKLAFTDIGSGSDGTITTPDDLAKDYYSYAYQRGAYVHSDSWGTDSPQYDAMGFDVDLFSWVFQDFVPVFAAGNLGYLEIDSTVSSPATAKNSISVGKCASLTSDLSQAIEKEALDLTSNVYNMYVSGGLPGSNADGVAYRVMLASFGPLMTKFVNSQSTTRLVAGWPADGCSPLSRPSTLKGKVVLLQRGNCTFTTKVGIAQAAGATAVVITNNVDTGFVQMPLDDTYKGPAITIPSASMPRRVALPLWTALQIGMQLTVRFQAWALPTARMESLAFFSSIGPTLDGRYKPDIIAPGTTISAAIPTTSAAASTSCNANLDVDRGTSMATPIVAGALTLIRQYFTDGFYPTGSAVPANAFLPSGPLLKAVLLGGAVGMTGVTPSSNPLYNNVPLEPPPSTRQGFGRLDLQRSLPLPGISTWAMQVVDWVKLRTTADSDKYCVQATGGPLRITLAWADRPADPSAAVDLVNDLDLTVYADSLAGYAQKGNGQIDRVNNVEQVSFDNLNAGLVVISVNAFNLPIGSQNYSLAVLGQFQGQLQSAHNPAWDGVTTPCTLPVVSILTGPEGLSNDNTPTFTWTTSDPAPNGHECKLTGQAGALAPAPLHNWATCASGDALGKLLDGNYYFEVRAKGYIIEDARLFTVDTIPPVTNLTSTIVDPVLAPRRATFTFDAYDNMTVSFECKLSPSQPVTGDVWGVGTLGTWEACASPQEYDSLTPGQWLFAVRATDAAGNVETATIPQYPWTVSLPLYAVIVGGTLGTVYSSSASFQFQASGGSPSAAAAARFQCKLQTYDGTQFLPAAFAPCTSPQAYAALQQGAYQFSVGVIGQPAGQEAVTQLLVDITGPQAVITRSPPAITQAQLAQFTFTVEGTATFQCRLLTAAEQTPATFQACTSPVTLQGLTDSRYTFQVAAQGAAGNMGPIAAYTFVVDTTPPAISNITFTDSSSNAVYTPVQAKDGNWSVAVPRGLFAVTFNVLDGLLGSGVNTTYCRMRAQIIQANTAPAGAGLPASNGFTVCNSLAASYRINLGQYAFVVYSVDQAGVYGHSLSYTRLGEILC
ncbi:hypothetical protein WJX72_011677 [[Myrmecia] bisecta]|uniref:Uncharacterized protein n=1 Tax=[Myrmecia] bisecta TaxID=41462 RepID=A0AAW1Q1R3_9CHLO